VSANQLIFSLVLESRLRQLLEREKRDLKKGKSRKLSNADRAAIEEELALFRFNPQRTSVVVGPADPSASAEAGSSSAKEAGSAEASTAEAFPPKEKEDQ
jgi:hypothetical protein